MVGRTFECEHKDWHLNCLYFGLRYPESLHAGLRLTLF